MRRVRPWMPKKVYAICIFFDRRIIKNVLSFRAHRVKRACVYNNASYLRKMFVLKIYLFFWFIYTLLKTFSSYRKETHSFCFSSFFYLFIMKTASSNGKNFLGTFENTYIKKIFWIHKKCVLKYFLFSQKGYHYLWHNITKGTTFLLLYM